MDSMTSTFAVVADEQYRRERATREFHAGGGRGHHPRFGSTWRNRRRAHRAAQQ